MARIETISKLFVPATLQHGANLSHPPTLFVRVSLCPHPPIFEASFPPCNQLLVHYIKYTKIVLKFQIVVSPQSDRVTMTDHHTASESFLQHFADETATRGGCPADWVWIVPPLSGSACPVFHQEMMKYHLKPSYEYMVRASHCFLLFKV